MNPAEGAATEEQRLLFLGAERKMPLNGSLELSPLCNMDCEMCYVRLSKEEASACGRLKTADEWLQLAEQLKEAGVLFLLLTGGEPLLYPDFKRLFVSLRKMGFILTVNTNGTLLDEAWADFFRENRPRRINLTLYGTSDLAYQKLCHYPDGFEKALKSARYLKDRGTDVRFSYSLTRENLSSLNAFFDLSEELGIPCSVDTYMMPVTRERNRPYALASRVSPEEAAACTLEIRRRACGSPEKFAGYCRDTLSSLEKAAAYINAHPSSKEPVPSSCLAGRCSFSVSWLGTLHPCVMLTHPEINVFETPFAEGWKILTEGMGSVYLNGTCASCEKRLICEFCPAAALSETGDINKAPEYLCRYSEALVKLMKEILSDL
ncbi:MAG: radical SAM protein [Lachnospiraceae bacterium]|nr:radical SAM protein [Lachnospiraceae bacterium]